MVNIVDVFDKLDDWRKLPNYQLCVRVDSFFAVHLKSVLDGTCSTEFETELIPEFHLHIPTLMIEATDEENEVGWI